MAPPDLPRRRCLVCRAWFVPAASALATQRVCGPACRKLRDNALARRRRDRSLEDAREDERLRQRKRRAAQREASTARASHPPPPPCHAPPSTASPAKLRRKILDLWDKEGALSRARLELEIEAILSVFSSSAGP